PEHPPSPSPHERDPHPQNRQRGIDERHRGTPLQGGLYISANAWEPYVEDQARHLDVLDHLTLLTTDNLRQGNEHEPAALARALWPQDEIADRYQRLACVARLRLRRLQEDAGLPAPQRLSIAIELAAEFTRAMEPDPLLPPELLPQPWPGTQARELIAQCWSLLDQYTEESERVSLFRLYRDVVRPATTDK
ncbi:PaaX family transcriptional regulator C-terminal domain-containing protein, partial [Streptomyces sp. NPDC015032]|uniref:PaaX family transcriptional regulator C-terminal domain-containing protein n=1 Tax=Streptomyces sp. NPDC015032 TaxID=3364937 RepID=UPI0037004A57